MNILGSGLLATGAKNKYLCTIVCGEALRQFDSLCADVEGSNPLTVETIILGLASYFFPVNSLLKQKRAMYRGMKKLCGLKVRRYAARLIDINRYLTSIPGETVLEKIGVTKFNEILLNSIPNSWIKKAYVQGFYCKSIAFYKAVNMFGRMEIV